MFRNELEKVGMELHVIIILNAKPPLLSCGMDEIMFYMKSVIFVVFAAIFLKEVTELVDATMRYGLSVMSQSIRAARRVEHRKHGMAFKSFVLMLMGTSDKRQYISDHRLFIENFMQRVYGSKELATDVFFHGFCSGSTVHDKMLHDLAESVVQALMLCMESMCLVGCIHERSLYDDLVLSMDKFSVAYLVFDRQRLAAAQPQQHPIAAPSIQGILE